MTRIYHLQRLAFGRSAFEPPDPNEETEDASNATVDRTDREGNISAYVQKYDARGYPINKASSALKHGLFDAQNDVLATIGRCAEAYEGRRLRSQPDPQLNRPRTIYEEDGDALDLDLAYASCFLLCSTWSSGLRHRLQALKLYANIPLSHVLRTEWRYWGSWRFLFPSSLCGSLLMNNSQDTLEMIDDILPLPEQQQAEETSKAASLAIRAFPILRSAAKLGLLTLLAPFGIHGILQDLGIQPSLPPLPIPSAYCSTLATLLGLSVQRYGNSYSLRANMRLRDLIPLLSLLTYNQVHAALFSFLIRYVCALIPKISSPDSDSLQALSELRRSRLTAYINYDHKLRGTHNILKIKEVLAKDLQTIGRLWQHTWDTVGLVVHLPQDIICRFAARMTTLDSSRFTQASASPDGGLPDDVLEDMRAFETNAHNTAGENSVLGMQPEFRDLLDPMPGSSGSPALLEARRRSHLSSPLAVETLPQEIVLDSGIQRPNEAVEVPENAGNVTQHGNDSATAYDDAGHQMTQPLAARLGDAETPQSPPQSPSSHGHRSRSSSLSPPIELSSSRSPDGYSQLDISIPVALNSDLLNRGSRAQSTISSTGTYMSVNSATSDNRAPRPPQRLTLLTDWPARTMVRLLSAQLTEIALLPLEAYIVRSVALVFWTTPGLASGGPDAATRWTNDVYSPRSWFGLGIKAGGWRGLCSYAGKMALVSGMQFAVSLSIWQLGYWWTWWRGMRKYSWGNL